MRNMSARYSCPVCCVVCCAVPIERHCYGKEKECGFSNIHKSWVINSDLLWGTDTLTKRTGVHTLNPGKEAAGDFCKLFKRHQKISKCLLFGDGFSITHAFPGPAGGSCSCQESGDGQE